MIEALGCPLLGTRIQICSPQCGRKRHGHHEKGIDPESHVEATDLGTRCLLSIAAELLVTVLARLSATELAKLSAKLAARILSMTKLAAAMLAELSATELAKLAARILPDILVVMLVHLPACLPYNLAQTSLYLGCHGSVYSFLNRNGVSALDHLLASNRIA